MTSVQIRNVPETTHRVLRRRAAEAGMSLQEYLLSELTAMADQPTLEEVLDRAGRHTGGRMPLADAADFLRAERDAR